jgi:hypothetical protein
MTDNDESRQPAADPNEPVVDQRRDALKKLGRFAAVTLRPSR